jgi:secreted PhoX family phosphatase
MGFREGPFSRILMHVEKAHKAGSMLMQRPENVNFNPDYIFAE